MSILFLGWGVVRSHVSHLYAVGWETLLVLHHLHNLLFLSFVSDVEEDQCSEADDGYDVEEGADVSVVFYSFQAFPFFLLNDHFVAIAEVTAHAVSF